MAKETDKSIILLPIFPKYAAGIRSGNKSVEFRKAPFANAVKYIVLYETMPIKMITTVFEVQAVKQDILKQLWKSYGKSGCISKQDYDSYYQDCDEGVAILVKKKNKLKRSLSLGSLGLKYVPRSYIYLSESQWSKIKSLF